jgi:monofunctional biosynthetic peptidoglycan transglycosylase
MRQRETEVERKGVEARRSQTWVPLTGISRHLLHAVLASEDQRFFAHRGVDWTALRESVEENVERRRLWRGGSTLTQQLAKNLFFGTSRTPLRKARELVVTRWLEDDLTKLRILTLYLNVIEWGDGVYGAEAAARHWYAKPAAFLQREEAAGLAAMIPNPRRINPRNNPRWFERARARVLGLMERSGYIGRDVADLGADPPDPGPAEAGPEVTPGSSDALGPH